MIKYFYGRRRNCYAIAIRGVHRSLEHCTVGRAYKKADMKKLWELRIAAGTEEHGLSYHLFHQSLARCNILLNRRILSDLAIWEPRTFKALTDVAKSKAIMDKLDGHEKLNNPSHVVTRGLLKVK